MTDFIKPPGLGASRRGFLGAAGGSIAGMAVAATLGLPEKAAAGTLKDTDIFNFALQLEYLESEYYLRALTGHGLPQSETGGTGTYGGVISVPPTPMVTFTSTFVRMFAEQVTQDEVQHVKFLRSAVGATVVAEPALNIGTAWNTLAQAAGIGETFDPYASEINFLLGAYVFEDVGATAYYGAVGALTEPSDVFYAAGIEGTESYHAAGVRSFLTAEAQANPASGIFPTADKISVLLDELDTNKDSTPLFINNTLTIVPNDNNGLIYARNPFQVLRIVYGNSAGMPGLFFPQGLNGTIK